MKALTLHQPWAGLVAVGTKTIETRSWSTKYRGPLAIHGGADEGPSRTFAAQLIVTHWPQDRWDSMLFGHVVATCHLIDVIPMTEDLPPKPWSDPWTVMTVDPWPIIHRWPGFGSADGRGHAEEKPYGDYVTVPVPRAIGRRLR